MSEQAGVEITTEKDAVIVTFTAAAISDINKIAVISDKVSEFVESNHPAKLVFDFSIVKFFCSQVLGLLLQTRAKLEEYNGEVVLSAINPQLYRVFKITNLDKIFRFFPDRDSAVRQIGND